MSTPPSQAAIEKAAHTLAVGRHAASRMTPREQAEAAWTPTSRFTVDQLEQRIRHRRGLDMADTA